MERDFLGLNSKNVALPEHQLSHSSSNNSGMQWSFKNKVSALPQLMSFKSSQPETAPNLTHRPYSSLIQKNDKNAGSQYAMAVHPFQNAESISAHRSQDVNMFPISNQPSNVVPLTFNVPVFPSQLVSSQPFGGVPIATSIPVPFPSSVVGCTEFRNASKPPGSTGQLTMFYAGSVCVFNDISPEKAQAIMLLASSGGGVVPQEQNNKHFTAQLKASFPNENLQGVPLLSLSSAGLTSPSKPAQTPPSHPNHSQPTKDASSIAPITPILPIGPTFVPAAVPQARKASLARFLEKRKERINICPYNIGRKASDCSSTTLDLMA